MRSFLIIALVIAPAIARAADIKIELTLAARRLGAKTNYSWTQTRILETTNVSPKFIFPVNGEFNAPASIHVAQHELQPDWEAMWEHCGVTNLAPLREMLAKRTPHTNELFIVGGHCAIKGQYADRCIVGAVTDWIGYSTPRPPLDGWSYYIGLDSPPHIEIEQLLAATQEITREQGAFILDLNPETLIHLRTNRSVLRPQSANGWVKLWISNALPVQYETRIVQTVSFTGGFGQPRLHTAVETNHTLTKIHSIGVTKIDVPPAAQYALQHPTVAGNERTPPLSPAPQ